MTRKLVAGVDTSTQSCKVRVTDTKAHSVKTAPRSPISEAICQPVAPLLANCGKKARKKICTLGLVTFMMTPRRSNTARLMRSGCV